MTLRELLKNSNYDTPLYLFGVDADAAATIRRGRRPLAGVTPLYVGAIGYALLGEELEDYLDRKVVQFRAEFQRSMPVLAVYQRLIGSREEIINGDNGVSAQPGAAEEV